MNHCIELRLAIMTIGKSMTHEQFHLKTTTTLTTISKAKKFADFKNAAGFFQETSNQFN